MMFSVPVYRASGPTVEWPITGGTPYYFNMGGFYALKSSAPAANNIGLGRASYRIDGQTAPAYTYLTDYIADANGGCPGISTPTLSVFEAVGLQFIRYRAPPGATFRVGFAVASLTLQNFYPVADANGEFFFETPVYSGGINRCFANPDIYYDSINGAGFTPPAGFNYTTIAVKHTANGDTFMSVMTGRNAGNAEQGTWGMSVERQS